MLKPCRVCGRPSPQATCPAHTDKSHNRNIPRSQRGYDPEYDKARKALLDQAREVWARGGAVRCGLCGGVILGAPTWSADHVRPVSRGGTWRDGLRHAHRRCQHKQGGQLARRPATRR